MSIPKEPRQLMINLMYIVLTAMLALNVSAEILNAFNTIDESMKESSEIVGHSNQQIYAALEAQAEAYSRFEPYREKAAEARLLAKTFYNYIESIKTNIVEAGGGLDEKGLVVRKTDKDIPTRMLVNEGQGNELKEKVDLARTDLIALLDEDDQTLLADAIPLKIKEVPADSDKKDWAQYTFQQMPIAAVLPILSKFQQDIRISETVLLNYFLGKTGVGISKPDAYIPIISMEKSYLTKGENFTGEISLSAYSSTADNIAVWVDGQSLLVENGKAVYTKRISSTGTKEHKMKVELTNPITGEVESFERTFSYEVGAKSVVVSADKMNVLYVGVDNPLSIVVAGIPSATMRVEATGTQIEKKSSSQYIAKPRRVGNAKITVSGEGLRPVVFDYRVKRIPDPVVKLGNKIGGRINAAEMKVQQGLIPVLEAFDFDARCKIVEFEVARVPKNSDALVTMNSGGRFTGRAANIIKQAHRNDTYFFDAIKVKCPGDDASRKISGLIFRIK